MRNQQSKSTPSCGESCPTEATIAAIGGRWKIILLWHLYGGKLRFSELRRKVPGISQKMLTEQLRELEGHGLVTRTVYAEVPPRVEYAATPLGESLRPVITAIGDWGRTHGAKITDVSKGDARSGPGHPPAERARRGSIPPLTREERSGSNTSESTE
jgi:DNA-binding HxlR family transcriptional regulator